MTQPPGGQGAGSGAGVGAPHNHAAEVAVFANRIRGGEGGGEPSSPKQRYEARRLARRLGITEPPPEVMEDRYRLEMWMAFF
jgi:hypothetical protein